MERYEDLIIVSMTSWTKRINNCKPVIESLINQSIKPNYIELNLSLDEFPNKENDLPTDLIDLIKQNKIIEINWVEGNDGVFKKIIPTLKKFYGKLYYILSVDDDWLYRSDYIEMMINYIKQYNADTFCLSNSKVIGNRQIYKSDCFKSNFWEKLTQDVIDTRIDDMYIEHYLTCNNKKFSCFKPNDYQDIARNFNQIYPNSHNTSTGQYSSEDIRKAYNIIKSIQFNNIAIYTCITGGYDRPTDGFIRKAGYDYYLFSDANIKTKSWNVITKFPEETNELDNTKKQRYIKTHPHIVLKDYDIVVYIDANTDVNDILYDYIESYKNYTITFKKHPCRDCIYDEIAEVALRGKEDIHMCEYLINRYTQEKFPRHYGLYEHNIIISHPNHILVKKLFEEWWKEIKYNSKRDQLSLHYVLWKNHLRNITTCVYTSHFSPKEHIHIYNYEAKSI